MCLIFFFNQKTAYEMRISDWSSDVCSSDLLTGNLARDGYARETEEEAAVRSTLLKTSAGAIALLAVVACGQSPGGRALSGAAIGVDAGPPATGTIVSAWARGPTDALTHKDDIKLGATTWDYIGRAA